MESFQKAIDGPAITGHVRGIGNCELRVTGTSPHIDTTNFTFPSDKLTIATLRKLHPELFDTVPAPKDGLHQPLFIFNAGSKGHIEDTIGSMLYLERFVAFLAYAEAMGIGVDEHLDFPPEEYKEELAEYYVRYGIAQGENHAFELIRDIERQGRNATQDICR